jgi:hypothetical protein
MVKQLRHHRCAIPVAKEKAQLKVVHFTNAASTLQSDGSRA